MAKNDAGEVIEVYAAVRQKVSIGPIIEPTAIAPTTRDVVVFVIVSKVYAALVFFKSLVGLMDVEATLD